MLFKKNLDRAKFLLYKEKVRKLTEKNFRKYFIDDSEYRGKKYHLDHKVSIKECFLNDILIEYAADPLNLEIVSTEYNLSKGSKCSMTTSELLEQIIERDDLDV